MLTQDEREEFLGARIRATAAVLRTRDEWPDREADIEVAWSIKLLSALLLTVGHVKVEDPRLQSALRQFR